MHATTRVNAIRFTCQNHLPIDITGRDFVVLVAYIFLKFQGHMIGDNKRTIFVEFAPVENNVFNLDGLRTGVHDIDDNPLCICNSVHVSLVWMLCGAR